MLTKMKTIITIVKSDATHEYIAAKARDIYLY